MLIDSHCHLFHCYEKIDSELVGRLENQFAYLINISINTEEMEKVKTFRMNSKVILNAGGIYPEKARFFDDKMKLEFLKLFEEIKPVAVGEVGIDLHWNYGDVRTQERLFRFQIEFSIERNLPLIIHSREAFEDTFRILKSYDFKKPFILHCFGYGEKEAEKFLSLNCLFSFAGNITYPGAENLRSALKIVPLDRILLETDAPYLSPLPHRGKKNTPFYIKDTYRFVADFCKIEANLLEEKIKENFVRVFNL
ncbi:MAG: TatD family hydrolase [Brevinematia bacterium]